MYVLPGGAYQVQIGHVCTSRKAYQVQHGFLYTSRRAYQVWDRHVCTSRRAYQVQYIYVLPGGHIRYKMDFYILPGGHIKYEIDMYVLLGGHIRYNMYVLPGGHIRYNMYVLPGGHIKHKMDVLPGGLIRCKMDTFTNTFLSKLKSLCSLHDGLHCYMCTAWIVLHEPFKGYQLHLTVLCYTRCPHENVTMTFNVKRDRERSLYIDWCPPEYDNIKIIPCTYWPFYSALCCAPIVLTTANSDEDEKIWTIIVTLSHIKVWAMKAMGDYF